MKKIPNKSNNSDPIDEYEIMRLAKSQGISIEEMKDMSFVSLINVLLSLVESESEQLATEEDVRRMFG